MNGSNPSVGSVFVFSLYIVTGIILAFILVLGYVIFSSLLMSFRI